MAEEKDIHAFAEALLGVGPDHLHRQAGFVLEVGPVEAGLHFPDETVSGFLRNHGEAAREIGFFERNRQKRNGRSFSFKRSPCVRKKRRSPARRSACRQTS